jgi:hypothetical protein
MNIQTNGNHFAFPNNDLPDGLTKREYFAAMAMQGLLANYSNRGMNIDIIVKQSVNAADALINALNETK